MMRLLIPILAICLLIVSSVTADDSSNDDGVGYQADAARELHHKKKGKKGIIAHPVVPLPQMNVNTLSPVQVQEEIVCPEGFSLVGHQCVKSEIVNGDYVCPPGVTRMGDECVNYIQGKVSCPHGYRQSGNRCIVTEVAAPQMLCSDGELDSTGTVCHTVGEQGVACPSGFLMDSDHRCHQSSQCTKTCPAGFTPTKWSEKRFNIHKAECVQESHSEAQPVCPEGFQMDGKKCFTVKTMPSRCPKGYRMSQDGTRCAKKVKKTLAGCPAGFQQFSKHHSVCEKSILIPPQLVCHDGSIFNSVSGQCETTLSISESCPPGFQMSNNNQCIQIVDKEGSCPIGTTRIGYGSTLRCQSSVDHEIIECCPPGFELTSGKCEKTEISYASTGCKGDCETVRVVKADLSCPVNYSVMGGTCFRSINSPCPAVAASVPAECEIYLSSGSLRSARAGDQIPSNCEPIVASNSLCPERFPAQEYCPPGASLENGHCVHRETLQVQPYCKVGTMDDVTGRCVKITRVPIKTECPDGTTRIGARCVSYEEHSPNFLCPLNSVIDDNDNCVVPVMTTNSGVPRVIRSAPSPVCSRGSLQNSMCHDVERISRQYVCPGNSIPANKHLMEESDVAKHCLEFADFVIPKPHKKFTKSMYYCPDGSLAKGKHCHSHRKAYADCSCPPDSTQNGELCYRYISAVATMGHVRTSAPAPYCPAGTESQGSKCLAIREANPEISCPNGYLYKGDGYGCYQSVPMILSCPQGSQETPDGCIRSTSIPASISRVRVEDCQDEYENECY